MSEKVFKGIDLSIISILSFTTILSLLYPPYRDAYYGIIYLLLLGFCIFLFIVKYKFSKEIAYTETPIDNFLFLLFCWYIVSSIFSINKFNSLNATVAFSVLLAYYYVIYHYAKLYFKKFLFGLIFISFILSIYGLYQYFYGFKHTLDYLYSNPEYSSIDIINRLKSNRIFSTFIYPNAFAGFLIMIIPVLIAFIKNEKKYRLLLLPVFILLIFALLLTKSVGAIISLITAIILIFILISDKSIKNFRAFFLWFLLVCAGLIIFTIKDRGWHNILSSFQEKYSSISKMLDVSLNFPLFGAGPGNFEEIYNKTSNNNYGYLKYAHNIIMQTVIELGLPGLILILTIFFFQLKIVLQNFFLLKTPQSKILVTSLLISITAFLIHNLVDFDIYNFELALVFVLLVSILNSQIIIGAIEIKKIKLVYYLGLNPGKRRSIIFFIISIILFLSTINLAQNIYILTTINILVAIGFALCSVSKEKIRLTEFDKPILLFLLFSAISILYAPDIYEFTKYITLFLISAVLFYLYSQFLRRYIYKIIVANYLIIIGIIHSFFAIIISLIDFFNFKPIFYNYLKVDINALSLFLIIPFCLLLNRIVIEKKIDYINLKILGLFIIILAQFLTANFMVLFLQLLIFILIWIYYNKHKQEVKDMFKKEILKIKLLYFILLSIILSIIFYFFKTETHLLNYVNDILQNIKLFAVYIKMILDKPLTGYGLGGAYCVFPLYGFQIDNSICCQKIDGISVPALFHIGIMLGLPGILLMLIIFYLIIKNLPETGGHRKVWSTSSGAYFSVLALILGFIFFDILHFPGGLFIFVILTAILSKEKDSISTIPKESLFFIKIYYFIHLIFAFLVFSLLIRPAIGNYFFNHYKKNNNLNSLEYAIMTEPLNSKYFYEKALFFEKKKKYKESLINYKKAVILSKKNYKYYQAIGKILSHQDDYKTSIKFYENSLKYNPYNVFAYFELATLYFNKLNNPDIAKKYIIKALDHEPDFVLAKHLLATIFRNKGDLTSALKEYNEIEEILLKTPPTTDYKKSLLDFPLEILYLNKALILKETGAKDQYLKYLKKYYEISKDDKIKNLIKQQNLKGSKN